MGAYAWVESRLFEALGAWALDVDDPEGKQGLAAHAREHAWHAELWHERLPTTAGMAPETLTAPANDGVAAALAAMADPQGEGRDVERLVGAYRVVLPRLIVAYSTHLGATQAVSDGPVVRALRLVLRDELEEWARGESLVQSLLGTEEDVRRAASAQARLEWTFASGGGLGPPAWPDSGFAGPGNGQP